MELSADLEPSGSAIRKRTDNRKIRAKKMSSGSDPPPYWDAVSRSEQQVCSKETYLRCIREVDLGVDKLKLRGDRNSTGYLGCGAHGKSNRAGGVIAPI